MKKLFSKRKPLGKDAEHFKTAEEKAGELYDRGFNCAQAVLQATSAREDQELIAMAEGFGDGIGNSGCLCGAISGGVLALGLAGKAKYSQQLVAEFKNNFQTTCCRSLCKNYKRLSKEHLRNCRKITTKTAEIVEQLLSK